MQLDPLTSYGLGTFAPSLQQFPAAKHLMDGDFTEGFTKRIIQHLTPQNSLTIPCKHLCSLTSAPPWYQLLLFSHHTPSLWASLQPQDWDSWASLVAQWLGVCLPMQGTRVQALVWEDPTCRGATRPVSHNY